MDIDIHVKYIYTLNSLQLKKIHCGSFITIDKDQLQEFKTAIPWGHVFGNKVQEDINLSKIPMPVLHILK